MENLNALDASTMQIRLAALEQDNQTLQKAADSAAASSLALEVAVTSLQGQIAEGQAEILSAAAALAASQEETKMGQHHLLASIAALALSQEEAKDGQVRLLTTASALEASQNETKMGLENLLASAVALASSRAEMNVVLERSAISAAALASSRAETKIGQTDLLASAVANEALVHANGLLVTHEAALERSVKRSTAALNTEIEERHRAENALRQSQKMEAVGQLTGGLAHDFNNMLQAVVGSLELLEMGLLKGTFADAHRHIANALSATSRAATITQRLLAFSRQQVLDSKPTSANDLISDMKDLIQRTVGPEISVELRQEASLWKILCDRNQMENALLNLCINARDAMAGGGRIVIESANVHMGDQAAKVRGLTPGEYVAVSVTDTGIGMPPEIIERAFEPFFTTKQIGEGTGLGLSMVYGFAKQSGGLAQMRSEMHVGTMVQILLPRIEEQGETGVEPAKFLDTNIAGAGKSILIVDDEHDARMQIAEFLTLQVFRTMEAADSASALVLLRSDSHIDMMISDIGLPGGMNGRQMADIARNLRPELKVLFITGYAKKAFTENGQLPHGMKVLAKPFSFKEMAAKITLMMDMDLERNRTAISQLPGAATQ